MKEPIPDKAREEVIRAREHEFNQNQIVLGKVNSLPSLKLSYPKQRQLQHTTQPAGKLFFLPGQLRTIKDKNIVLHHTPPKSKRATGEFNMFGAHTKIDPSLKSGLEITSTARGRMQEMRNQQNCLI
jgi:hypothetical protein